jgi:hypothetical protein
MKKSTRAGSLLGAAIGVLALLPIETSHAQESFEFDMTLDSTTVDPRTGEVTISGTVTCSEAANGWGWASISQPIGREGGVQGSSNYLYFYCDQDGEPHTFSIFAYNGRFAPGRAVLTLEASACGWYSCDSVNIHQAVRLRPSQS